METRIAKLEELMADARARLDQCATKADVEALRAEMHKGFADMIKWIVGTAIVLGGTGIVVITFVLNNAVPKAPPPTPLPPVVIYTQPAPVAPSVAAPRM
jgi:hypothetical protein